MSEFWNTALEEEEGEYFSKTNLTDCDENEFKQLFGLVSHEEADRIRAKANVSKRRTLRTKTDLLKNRSGPEDTGKFLQVSSRFLQVRKKVLQEEPIVTGSIEPHLVRIGREVRLVPPPQPSPSKSNSPHLSTSNTSNSKDFSTAEPMQCEDVDMEDGVEIQKAEENKGERFIVTQTREMKRKGIKLPRGWEIHGTRKESEARSQGQVYTYFRIDWTFLVKNIKMILRF